MPPNGAQLVLLSEQRDGTFDCTGFADVSVVNPVLIALCSSSTPSARANLAVLRSELLNTINSLSPGIKPVTMPCRGIRSSPVDCKGFDEPDTQKLLVIVGDKKQPFDRRPYSDKWLTGGPAARVLPIFHGDSRTSLKSLLPANLTHINADFWTSSIAHTIPTILALANIAPVGPRIFISYRQSDSAALAIQIFDALSHAGFEVFLDHFRIPPGVNFQSRLTQELGDKAMLLVIESPNLLSSAWVLHEIDVAKVNSLGIFALQVPGGTAIPTVDSSLRSILNQADFESDIYSASAVLKEEAVAKVVEHVRAQHDRALIRRRQILHDSLEGALASEGVPLAPLTPKGLVPVTSKNGTQYLVWLTPRPPELMDFHRVHGATVAPSKGVIVGLSSLMEPTRFQVTTWLAGLSSILMVEEGQLKNIATQLARGTL